MKKSYTLATRRNMIFGAPKLTIGLDLGDRTSYCCILNEAGKVIRENRLPTTPKVFSEFLVGSCGVAWH